MSRCTVEHRVLARRRVAEGEPERRFGGQGIAVAGNHGVIEPLVEFNAARRSVRRRRGMGWRHHHCRRRVMRGRRGGKWRRATGPWAPSRLRPAAVAVPALLLVILGIAEFSNWLMLTVGRYEGSTLEGFDRMSRGAHPVAFAALLVFGSLGPGFGEELMYRGFIQPRLVARWGAPVGIGVTAALFGLMHMDLAQGLFAFCVGLATGWVAWRAGTVWPTMVAHAACNGLSFALSRLYGDGSAEAPGAMELAVFAGVLALGVGLLVWLGGRTAK